MQIKPNSQVISYNGYIISLVYSPEDHCWKWRAYKVVRHVVEFEGKATEMNKAVKAAKRTIDKEEN